MRIGGIGNVYPTYVYNPNTVSSKSMDKLSRISDNVLDKKVDYSERAAEENQNPLKKGETIDFEGVLAKQMQQGQNRAAKIMPGGMKPAESGQTEQINVQEQVNTQKPEKTAEKVAEDTAGNATDNAADAAAGGNANVLQMQRAIQAYEMFMTA